MMQSEIKEWLKSSQDRGAIVPDMEWKCYKND